MVKKNDVISGFVPDEEKLENWLDEQLLKQENILTITKHKFLVIAYADMPSDFYDKEYDREYVTTNFVTRVVDKYNSQGNWKIRYDYNKQHNFVVFIIR